MPLLGCPDCDMPNGYPFWAQCHWCRQFDYCHGRNDEDYTFWVGVYCWDCLDWIDDDDDRWDYWHYRNTGYHRFRGRILCCGKEHPLVGLAQDDALMGLLTDFLHPLLAT